MSARYRFAAGFAVLLALFVALITVQFVVGSRMRDAQDRGAARLTGAVLANQAVLQHLTDAESGVRGFQLTGRNLFLEPYESGRVGAAAALDDVARYSDDPTVRELLSRERSAAADWLYAYALPIVNAGTADADEDRAARGKDLFDRLRTTNADVDAGLDNQRSDLIRADRHAVAVEQSVFVLLALAFLLTGLGLAGLHQRQLLAPLEHIRRTLQRLAAGDRSARAVPTGSGELRAVIGTLNELAADTERMIAADQARAVRAELRQAVAAELQSGAAGAQVGRRIAALIGAALNAESVHARVTGRRTDLTVCWPAGAPEVSEAVRREIDVAERGSLVFPPGAMATPLGGDVDYAPGLLYVCRPGAPDWTGDERRLLTELATEIDYTVRQARMRRHQARLISELRLLDEHKDAFVSTVTHELRTPLTSILGYGEMLAEGDHGDLSSLQQRGVDAIMRNALRLQDIIADLLLLDRVNARAGAHAAPVDLAVLAAGLHDDLGPSARAKNLVSTLEAGPAWVHGDGSQLRSALRNLLENAIKFTPAGGRVDCRVVAGPDAVVVTISDSGIGIPADDLPGLFTPFHRAANAMDQAVQGTGLGLAIVRNIATEHGGSVLVSSEPGRGSTFTLTLPVITVKRPGDSLALAN
jgi:two-component system, OmpR family, phosphate regulon sensor histidine kinase PhoR